MENIFVLSLKPITLTSCIRENKYSYDSSYCEILEMEVFQLGMNLDFCKKQGEECSSSALGQNHYKDVSHYTYPAYPRSAKAPALPTAT